MRRYLKIFVCCISSLVLCIGIGVNSARALSVDFNTLPHGTIVSNQFPGVSISADNPHRPFDHAIVFDSHEEGTLDSDLEFHNDSWSGGNISGVDLGKMLIIAENNTGWEDGTIDTPDDEGRRRKDGEWVGAGSLFFDFNQSIESFGFDLVDVENVEAGGGYFATFFSGADQIQLSFTELASMDSTILWGDNTANRIAPILASDYGFESFDSVEIHLGGSGAVGGFQYDPGTVVPEPGTLLLLGAGLLGLLGLRKKVTKK